jgi:hypothetical protein
MHFEELPSQGAGGNILWSFKVINMTDRSCAVAGVPEVEAAEPGQASVTGEYTAFFGTPQAGETLRPGESAVIRLTATPRCRADRPANERPPQLIYHSLTFRFGGSEQTIATEIDVSCGLGVASFTFTHS